MSRFLPPHLLLNRSFRRHVVHVGRRNDNPRMTAVTPVILLVLDHVHLVTPLSDMRTGFEVHG